MKLQGQTALITGASSGIGAAIARAFAAQGANVAVAARREVALQQIIQTLPGGANALAIPTDVGDEHQVQNMVEKAEKAFGQIDILVNNAGYGVFKPITELTAEELDAIYRVNVRGVFLCSKYVLPGMYARKKGTVITISSIAGRHGFPGGGAYCATKFAVMGLMESMFLEARSENVRVVTLTPGSVDTPFFDEAHTTAPDRERILQPEDIAEAALLAVTLPERALIRELDIRPTNIRG